MKRKLDIYWLVAMAALAVYGPFGVYTVTMFKTGHPLDGWLFEDVPGWGLGIVMLLGQAMVARAAITLTYAPTWVRAMFGVVWAIVFGCVQAVVPLALFAGSQKLSIPVAIESLMDGGWLGAVQYGAYFALTLAAEGTIPALIIASRIEAQHAEEEAAKEATAAQEKADEMSRLLETIGEKGGKRKPIERTLAAVVANPGLSTAELAKAAGVSVTTISNSHGVTLAKSGKIHRQMGTEGATWWPGRATPVAGEQASL